MLCHFMAADVSRPTVSNQSLKPTFGKVRASKLSRTLRDAA